MTLNDVNDPDPHEPYAYCPTCCEYLQTAGDAALHREATRNPWGDRSLGHALEVRNPTRPERVSQEVDELLEQALETDPTVFDVSVRIDQVSDEVLRTALYLLEEAVADGDMSLPEVAVALEYQPVFRTAWLDEHPRLAPVAAGQYSVEPLLPSFHT